MIKTCVVDLLKAPVDVIVHQVNCKGVMGAGLAKQIREQYPDVYTRYCDYCRRTPVDKRLGSVQVVGTQSKIICNLFAQDAYGRDARYTDYNALRLCLMKVYKFMLQRELQSVGIPSRIGCGLAGGDWNVVQGIIQEVFADTPITVLICERS